MNCRRCGGSRQQCADRAALMGIRDHEFDGESEFFRVDHIGRLISKLRNGGPHG
jgi:hypothetical protein